MRDTQQVLEAYGLAEFAKRKLSALVSYQRRALGIACAALGAPPVLIVMEATGHYWKNLFAVLAAAGHEVALVNPLAARRFQEASLERAKTDAIDAAGLARLGFEKRPAPSRLNDEVAEALRELVRHRDRLRQDFDDRVRQLMSQRARTSLPATVPIACCVSATKAPTKPCAHDQTA